MFLFYRNNSSSSFSIIGIIFLGIIVWIGYILIKDYFEKLKKTKIENTKQLELEKLATKKNNQENYDKTRLINRIRQVRLSLSEKGYYASEIEREINSIRIFYKRRTYILHNIECIDIEERLDLLEDYCKKRKVFNWDDVEKSLIYSNIYNKM